MYAKLAGFSELDKTLGQLPKAVAKRTLRKIGMDAMQPMADDMKARAPRKFGDLVEGITVGTNLARSQKKFGGLLGGPKSADMVIVHAGPGTHPQAVIQEIGSFKEKAQPYVTPAWEAGHAALLDRVASGMADPIMKAAARAAKKGKLRSA